MAEKWKPMTISLTGELRERMSEFPEVNWSEVARDAFEERLRVMESQTAKLPAKTLARLVASRERANSEHRTIGYESGKQWAENEAEWPELERMAKAARDGLEGWDVVWAAVGDELTVGEAGEMLSDALGLARSEEYTDAMLEGFAEGAIAVYSAVD